MPIDLEAALAEADRLRDYEQEVLTRLVRCPSVRGEVSDIHELCAKELERLGMEVALVVPEVDELRRNREWCPPQPAVADPAALVSVLGSKGEGPGILLFAHIDTEPPEPSGEWLADPYRATLARDRIHGVGAADDKAGVASVLAASRVLLPRLRGVRLVVGLVHGKLGGGLGTLPLMAEVGEVDMAVYSHPAETGRGLSHFKVASRGYFNFRIETSGHRPEPVEIRTPSSEDPRQGVNAFHRLQQVLPAVDQWAAEQGVLCSVNQVRAGVDPMSLPEQAGAEGAVWFRHGTFQDTYQSLRRAASGAGASATELIGMRSNPAQMPTDHPLVTATTQAIAAETGIKPGLYPGHVASDIRFPIRCLGAPTVGFGPLAGNFYGPNEWVDTHDMHRTTRVLVRLISKWAAHAGKETAWPRLRV